MTARARFLAVAALAACSSGPEPTGSVVVPLPQDGVAYFGLTAHEIVWAEGDVPRALYVAPKAGGASPQQIQTFEVPVGGPIPKVAIATADDAVYVATGGSLYRWAPGDATTSAIATGFDGVDALAVHGDTVAYVAEDAGGAGRVGTYSLSANLHRIVRTGATLYAYSPHAETDGQDVYWIGIDSSVAGASNAGDLLRTTLSDGTTVDVSQGGVSAFTFANGWIGWITGGIATPAGFVPTIRGGAAGSIIDLAQDPDAVAIASDGDRVDVAHAGRPDRGTGAIVAYPTGGGPAVTLGRNERQPVQLAVDADDIYWVNGGLYHYASDGDTLIADGDAAILRMPR